MSHTWVVTGANRGLGLELARQLQARGEEVVATTRSESGDLTKLGVRVELLDTSDEASIRTFAERLEGIPIDILINNAGTGGDHEGLDNLATDTLRRCFLINSMGPLLVTKALLPNLRAGNRRVVVQMTSKMGSVTDNTSGGSYPYRMSKAALNMANRSLSIDLAPEGITCTLMHPGWVRTDMGGSHAPLSVEESVRSMLNVIDKLSAEDSGRFFDYSGEQIPW